jgi:uncharacterized damage-inducible protein DinB
MAKKSQARNQRKARVKGGGSAKRASRTGRRPRAAAVGDQALRHALRELLRGGGAHLDFDATVADIPAEHRGAKPAGVPYSLWRILEHMRIAQWDILEFSRNPKHVSPKFPEGYWPQTDAPPDDAAWDASVNAFRADLKAMESLVTDPATDLSQPIPHGEGQTITREALLVADHNAYHLGQMLVLRRLLGIWNK